jgi:hypothetical protein
VTETRAVSTEVSQKQPLRWFFVTPTGLSISLLLFALSAAGIAALFRYENEDFPFVTALTTLPFFGSVLTAICGVGVGISERRWRDVIIASCVLLFWIAGFTYAFWNTDL